MRMIRYLVLAALSTALTLWILQLSPDHLPSLIDPAPQKIAAPVLELITRFLPQSKQNVDAAQPSILDPAPPMDFTKQEMSPSPPPPPTETGSPEGNEGAPLGPPASDPIDDRIAEIEEIMSSVQRQDTARKEISGDTALGFETAFRCRPEDQLALARYFGETIVLVPKSAIDPKNPAPRYYSLDPGPPVRVETIQSAPPLSRYRQYRDLFDFEYSRLPDEIRDLRRRVRSRSDIYLFAALIPVREWTLILARREEALRKSETAGSGNAVRRYTLSYRTLARETYDIRVDEILFADQRLFRPNP